MCPYCWVPARRLWCRCTCACCTRPRTSSSRRSTTCDGGVCGRALQANDPITQQPLSSRAPTLQFYRFKLLFFLLSFVNFRLIFWAAFWTEQRNEVIEGRGRPPSTQRTNTLTHSFDVFLFTAFFDTLIFGKFWFLLCFISHRSCLTAFFPTFSP